MAKKTVPVASYVDPRLVAYRVAEGVALINGSRVSGETVQLTPEQALYDVAVGRLVPVDAGSPPSEAV